MKHSIYTWRDVEYLLGSIASAPWTSIDTSLDSLAIGCSPDQEQACKDALRQALGPSLSEDGTTIHLESADKASRSISVVLDTSDEDHSVRRDRWPRPLWRDALSVPDALTPLPPGSPGIFAFYSYKGGVGRTTSLLATLGAVLEKRRSLTPTVLVVDADLEAPGLSFDIDGRENRFSLPDFLGLLHDSDQWRKEVIPLAAERVRINTRSIELATGKASFFFLPAFRSMDSVFAPNITFDQVVRAKDRSYSVAEAFADLGRALGADIVLIDLRAGVTEVSSPLLLDSRVQTVLVTSCGSQSIAGTQLVLKQMGRRAKAETSPEIVLTMVPPDMDSASIARLSAGLKEALPQLNDDDVVTEIAQPNVHEVRFAQELVHFDSLHELLVDRLPGTDMAKRLGDLAESFIAAGKHTSIAQEDLPKETEVSLRTFAQEAKKLEYAEGNSQVGMLVTPALSALVNEFPRGLPAAVVLGAKGAGKTFAWGQMILAGTWRGFAERVLPPPGPLFGGGDAQIFPLLKPHNMGRELSEKVRDAEARTWKLLGSEARQPLAAEGLLSGTVSEGYGSGPDFWADRIAARLGLAVSAGESVASLARALSDKGTAICIAIDGLEDSFQPSPQEPLSSEKQDLLRSLLQRFTVSVRDLRSPYLGIVTFVRRDLAQASIVQNFGQFAALHDAFSIVWTPTEALRLVAWLLRRSNIETISAARIPSASYNELQEALTSFWGVRLGSKSSKEAHTDRWVIAALSDFQGRLQARDLVRLVRYAAESVESGPSLTPKALRDALVKCSSDKIHELTTEIPGLSSLFGRFRSGSEEERKIPFRREDFQLSSEEVSFLEAQGIVIQIDEGELYLPEIVRHGLGFRLDKGRRAKVLALYRAAQAKRN